MKVGKQHLPVVFSLAAVAVLLLIFAISGQGALRVGALGATLPLFGLVVYLLFVGNETSAAEGSASLYNVEKAEIDPALREIRFNGDVKDVQPRVFDLVLYLIENRDRAVGKDELFEKVWPNVVVSESSLTQSVKRARDLFRDNGMSADVIRTVHSRGYRFGADVAAQGTPVAAPASSGMHALVVGVLAAVLLGSFTAWMSGSGSSEATNRAAIPPNSLVVLPFQDLTNDSSVSYFPLGLTETVSNALSRVNGLRVIGRSTASAYRGTDLDPAAFARSLNVANVISGSVQKQGAILRITVSLTRVMDSYVLWSANYDRELKDVFDVQDDVTRSIVDRMEVLLSEELTGFEVATSVSSADAYQLLLRANQLRLRRTETSLASADGLYREALRHDPRYPAALVGLASTVYQRATLGSIDRTSAYSEAIALNRQALDIDANDIAALVLLAEIQHRYFWDFAEARTSFESAFEISPGSSPTLSAYSRFLAKIGEFDSAVDVARSALELNPLDQGAKASLVLRLIRVGQVGEAKDVLGEMKDERPDNGDLPWLEALVHLQGGEYQDALQRIAEDEFEYIRLSISAIALHHLGRTAEAASSLDRLIETDADGAAFQIGEVYAQWGRPNDAFEWLQRAYRQGDPGLAELISNVHFEPLYGDDRFDRLLADVGLPARQATHRQEIRRQ